MSGSAKRAVQLIVNMCRRLLPPHELCHWVEGIWRPWYAAAWAEAAVLAGAPDAPQRVGVARESAAENTVAAALVERAAALAAGDRGGVLAAARALDAAGCRYQWARSLLLAGGPERAEGASALAAMGALVV